MALVHASLGLPGRLVIQQGAYIARMIPAMEGVWIALRGFAFAHMVHMTRNINVSGSGH